MRIVAIRADGLADKKKLLFRKILVSVKFLSAILGPEMAAPILWTPGKMPSFCRRTSMSIKFFVFWGGGGFWVLRGGGGCRFYFYGRGDFSEFSCWSDSQIASNLRFAIFSAPQHDSQIKRVSVREPSGDSRESGVNRFARIGPSQVRMVIYFLGLFPKATWPRMSPILFFVGFSFGA